LIFEFLEEYRAVVGTDDNVKRYFNLLGVNFVLNDKED
jgi:hypothetical protein